MADGRTPTSIAARAGQPALLFVVFGSHRLQIFGFDDQAAVETLDIIHPIAPSNNHGTGVLTSGLRGLHKAN